MKRNVRTAKIGIVLGLLLISSFVVFAPLSKAGPLMNAYTMISHINVEYDESAAYDPFLPVEMIKEIPLVINFKVTGYLAEHLEPIIENTGIFIFLKVNETPEWCAASIIPPMLELPATTNWQSADAILSVIVNENAPAFFEENIKLEVKVGGIGPLQGGTFYQNVPFVAGYLPILSLKIPDSTYKLLQPDDTASFDIDVENLGNAKTRISCKIMDVPTGWTAYIDSTVVVGSGISGESSKRTIQLVVKPPYEFGYHNEREVIQVSITPSYFGNSSLIGKEYLLSFVVQNRGFSTPGFETVLVVFALMAVALIIKKHNRGKINGNDGGEK